VPAAASAPDLVLTFGALPKGHAGADVGASALAGLAHLRVPVDGVMAPQARGLLSGAVTDWQAVGAPSSLPVRPILLDGLPLPKGLTLAASAQRAVTTDALLAALRSTPGSLAVAPMEAADWTVRNLGIDGVYPAQGRGGSNGADLPPFRLRLGASKALIDHGLDVRALARSFAPALAAAAPAVDMVVTGDIILGCGVNDKMVAYNDYLYPYRKVRDEFLLADWRVANLECTISDLVPIPTDPFTFTFITRKKAVDGLVYAGIQTVSLANNHADNGGVPSFLDMIDTLHGHGIATTGGGKDLPDARRPVIQTVKGVRFALLGYNEIPPGVAYGAPGGGGVAPVDLATLPQDIAVAQALADVVIPFFHWGIEYTKDPTQHQQAVARAAIDAGGTWCWGRTRTGSRASRRTRGTCSSTA
jgi:Bacterial capsule synthesis protein PGA_cap